MLLPYIIGLLSSILVVWIICYLVNKYVIPGVSDGDEVDSTKKVVRTIATIVSVLLFVGFFLFVINMASVNEMPRTELDQSGLEQGKSNFQERMNKDANQPKVTSDTTTKY